MAKVKLPVIYSTGCAGRQPCSRAFRCSLGVMGEKYGMADFEDSHSWLKGDTSL
jgi:hypothetical protein